MEISFIAIVYALAVLTILALIIKVITYVVRPKETSEAMPKISTSVPAEAQGLDEEVALAITAVHKYLTEKGVGMSRPQSNILSASSWVISWRLECTSNVDRINQGVKDRWRRWYI